MLQKILWFGLTKKRSGRGRMASNLKCIGSPFQSGFECVGNRKRERECLCLSFSLSGLVLERVCRCDKVPVLIVVVILQTCRDLFFLSALQHDWHAMANTISSQKKCFSFCYYFFLCNFLTFSSTARQCKCHAK